MSLDKPWATKVNKFSFSMRVVLLAFMILAAGFAALTNVSLYTLMWARTLASGALIAATVAWTASTGQTKAFCRGYAAAGWSYLLLAHSDIAGKNLRSGRSYEELLHVHVAQTVRYALSGEATWLTDDLFALTFSFVFAMFVSCLAGAVAAQYADLRQHDRSSM